MSEAIKDTILARLAEVNADFEGLDEQVAELTQKRNSLRAEKKQLEKLQAIVDKTPGSSRSGGYGREVDYPELLEAVRAAKEPATSKTLAETLNATPVRIARKLVKLVDDGALTGSKIEGYSAVAGAEAVSAS